ncbi:MAG: YCF48-related protein [Bacteroidales bacterium]|nr:YCF48-related protein [Bacteroidales bacterium]
MKKKIFFLIVCFLFINLLKAQWTQLTPPFQGFFKSISFPDSNIGYISGIISSNSQGIIIKTTNGGANWSLACHDTASGVLTSVFFIDQNIGYAAGYFGAMTNTVLKTIDGGTTWTRQYYSNSASGFKSIYFINADTGYIVGTGIIIKTTNGGTNWTTQSGNCSSIRSVYFLNKDTGYVVGDGCISKTTDGGSNWINLNLVDWSDELYSVFFVNSEIGYFVGYGVPTPYTGHPVIYKTIDGGLSKISLNTNISFVPYSAYFFDENTGYVVGSFGTILKTINGGNTWFLQNSNTTEHLKFIQFTDTITGYIVGNNLILKTNNGGITWNKDDIKINPINIYPNPAKSQININFSITGKTNIIICDIYGREVYSNTLYRTNNDFTETIDVSSWAKGMYIVNLSSNEEINTCKLIVE